MLSLLLNAGVAGAAVIPSSACSFRMSGAGLRSGPLGELSGGKIMFGDVPQMSLRIDGGRLWDLSGQGCWWTPPSQVLQCDVNQAPDTGFQIDCSGQVTFRGQRTFYQCAAGSGNQYNIYLNPNQGVNCGEVTLTADSCQAGCGASVSPTQVLQAPVVQEAPIIPVVQQTPIVQETPIVQVQETPIVQAPIVQAPVVQGCAAKLLSGTYEHPQLIIPVDKSIPNTVLGTSYYGQITPTRSALFNFDIPQGYSGKTCSLVYALPTREQLSSLLSNQISSLPFSLSALAAPGSINFSMLKAPATLSTSWSNQPALLTNYGATSVALGNSYTIASFPCPAGQNIGFGMSSCESAVSNMNFFQTYKSTPMGLYITQC